MRVCFLLCQGNMYSGGQGVYLHYLSRELVRLGHEVEAIVGPPYPVLDEAVRLHRLPTYSRYWLKDTERPFFPSRTPLEVFRPVNLYELTTSLAGMFSAMAAFSIRAYERFQQLSRERPFDVVHDNQVLGYGTLLIRATGTPVVATIHHPLSVDRANRVRGERSLWGKMRAVAFYPFFMQEVVARGVDRVITVSDRAKSAVGPAFGLRDDQMAVVENGVDAEQWCPRDDIGRGPARIVFVGNSEDENKGARYLIDALGMLRKDVDDWELVVVDDRDRLWLLPRLALRRGIAFHVRYTGRLPANELVELYNRATVVVAPSLFEGFGLPAAEAMACGTPVIATTVGAHSELVRDGETGYLVPPGDAPALAAALRKVLQDPEAAEEMGRAGRQRVVERFTWRRAARSLVDIYEEVSA